MSRVLLTEDATPTARQVVTVLGRAGHDVEALATGRHGLTRGSRWVVRRHPAPPMGADPDGYLATLVQVLSRGRFDVLLPTHEQVALLARHADRLAPLVREPLAVPTFDALLRVQDKSASVALLDRLGVPQPPTELVSSVRDLVTTTTPAFVKLPVSTASRGVWPVHDRDDLARVARDPGVQDAFDRGWPVLVQGPVDGPLLMVQTVLDHGRLVAAHVSERVRVGVGNAASLKISLHAPEAVTAVARIGESLVWHGALSADVVQDPARVPRVIDLNPRLVEPVPAALAGTDLVTPLLGGPAGPAVAAAHPSRRGVRTSMALMALLRQAEDGAGRRGILGELASALRRTGPYAGTTEELLGIRGDRRTMALTGVVAGTLLARPNAWRGLSGGSATDALTPDVWQALQESTEH